MSDIRNCMLGLLLWLPVGVWATPITITAQQTAVVQGAQITIGDVAEVHGESSQLVAKVRGIVIGQAPPAGHERTLHAGYIATRLKQHGFQPQDVELQTPPKLRVRRASQHMTSRDLEAAVIQAIQAQMPWDAAQTTIRILRGIEPVVLPPGPVQTAVSFPIGTDFIGPTSFTVTLLVAGNAAERLFGTADIEVTQDAVTTTRPLPRHHIITAQDLGSTRVSLARLPRRLLIKPEEVIGKRTQRPLQAHAMIHAYEVEALPLIRQGDAVLIVVESSLLKVSTLGEALEPGQEGDTIRVKNVSSQRELRAVVVDKKTVRVPF